MKSSFLKSKKFKAAAILVSIASVLLATITFRQMQTNTNAATLQAPFYANERGDSLFTVKGHGDLDVWLIRKEDASGSGPLVFCLNKQKQFPTDKSILYQSVDGDDWVWELDMERTPTDAQVDAVKRALYAYKYIFPSKMENYGLTEKDVNALYTATQIAQWAILEEWEPSDVKIKKSLQGTGTELEQYANDVHDLFTAILKYAKDTSKASYEDGIKLVFQGTNTKANYTYQSTDYITTDSGESYFRSELMQALPKQKKGYYRNGEYAFTYKVSLVDAPEGTRIVNENGVPQKEFSTQEGGVGSNFYIDVPLEAVVNQKGSFKVKVKTTVFRKDSPILWRPITETAYQTLGQSATTPEEGTATVTLKYEGIQEEKVAQILVTKKGEQLNTFETSESEYGIIYTPVYKKLPLKDAKYTIEIKSETDNAFIEGHDGNIYVTGQNLIQNGNVVTGSKGIAQFNLVPLDKNRDTTSYTVIEKSAPNGYLLNADKAKKVVQIDKTSGDTLVTGKVNYTNTRVKFYFSFNKEQEYVKDKDTKAVGRKPLEGAVFKVCANETITSYDGTKIKKGDIVGLVTSDKDGIVKSTDIDLPLGYDFYIQEVKTADNLVLSNTKYYFTTDIQTGDDGSVKIPVITEDGKVLSTMTNKIQKAALAITKQEETLDKEGKVTYVTAKSGKGYEFKVYNDAECKDLVTTLTEENFENGQFKVTNLVPGRYYVKETKSPSDFVKNDKVYKLETSVEKPGEITIKNTRIITEHEITKYDITRNENKPFAGVKFDIKYNGNVIDTVTTDKEGKASFELMSGLDYTINEHVPAGYEIVGTKNIKVKGGADKNIIVENKKTNITGNIKLTKTEEASKKTLANVGFAVYRASDKDFQEPLMEDVTDEFGNITFKGLSPDEYVLVETMPLKGYIKSGNAKADLTKILDGDTVEVNVTNEKFYGEIEVKKVDATDGSLLEGAEFGLFVGTESGEPIKTAITNKEGIAKFTGVEYGQYFVKELVAPKGYVLSDKMLLADMTDVNVKTIQLTAENQPMGGFIKIIKKDTETEERLSGAKFSIYQADGDKLGKYIDSVVTNEEGEATLAIKIQDVYVVEIIAPNGYALLDEPILAKASEMQHEETLEVVIYNAKTVSDPIKGSVCVEKFDAKTMKHANASFRLENEIGEEVEIGTTTNGTLCFENLPLGEYVLSEFGKSEGYIINKTRYNITVSERNLHQVVEFINIPEAPEKAKITLLKKDEDSLEPLEGVEFTIYRNEEIYAVEKTNAEGIIELNDVPNGRYSMVETKPLADYEHNENTYEVKINDDSRFGYVVAYNKKKVVEETGTIIVDKYDADSHERLDGVEFKLQGVNVEYEATTKTENGGKIVFENLELGRYKLIETKALDGYESAETVAMVTVDLKANKDKKITIKVPNHKVEESKPKPNPGGSPDALNGTITLIKYDAVTKKTLHGVEFLVYYDKNNNEGIIGDKNLFKTVKTDKNGKIVLENLEDGTYVFKETSPLNGYKADVVTYTVTISKDEKVAKIEVFNERMEETSVPEEKPKKPEIIITDTGLDGNVPLFAVGGCLLMMVAITGFGALYLMKLKEKSE